MSRKYNKRNLEYWAKKTQPNFQQEEFDPEIQKQLVPKMVGEEYKGSYDPQAATRAYQMGNVGGSYGGLGGAWNGPQFRFPNVYQGILPYQSVQSASWIGLPDAIELCQKAYANIAVVGNAIETQVEFSCSEIHLKCKNKTALKSCKAWLDRINIDDFQEEYYREYHRSANVFIYRVYGKLKQSLIDELNTKFGFEIKDKEIVVGYIVLNPVNVVARNCGIGLEQSYVKFLTSIEFNSLKSSEFGKEMLKQLGVTEEQMGDTYPTIYLEFDSTKLVPIFNRKQSYEPLAVPPLWSLMDDLEIKLKMKRADESVLITVENIILHVSHGAKKEDGGMNPLNHAALTQMFQNKLTNRVLITDYTTKMDFVIPDLKMVLGKDKYEQVDKDIKEGLQTIFIGGTGEKFSNQMTQLKMFLKKLEGGRKKFKKFLEGEIESFCGVMGFKQVPTIELESIDLEDPVQFQRLVSNLLQNGILTPDIGFKVMKDGVFPSPEESLESQEEYKKQRDKGLFSPLAPNPRGGASPQGAAGRPNGTKGTPQKDKRKSTIKGDEEIIAEETEDADKISIKGVTEIMKEINYLYKFATEKLRIGHKKDVKLDDSLVKEIVLNSLYNSPRKNWKENVAKTIDSKFEFVADNKEIKDRIKNISEELAVDQYLGAIVYHTMEAKI